MSFENELKERLRAVRRPAEQALYDALKRMFDILGASALLFFLSPLLVAVGLAVWLTSKGPIIFTQARVGLDGRLFTIFKFRSMYEDVPRYGYHPDSDSDARVTPVGYWLRKLSLDELPQLANILLGDLSFVGPRPEMPFIVKTYDCSQLRRLTVKPGLTGLWQISADRGKPIHWNVHHDLRYIDNRSLGMDMNIFFKTPFALFQSDKAR